MECGESEECRVITDSRLGSYESLLFALVLETALLQLRILDASSFPENVNPAEPRPPHKEKLFRDRCRVEEMVRATFAELLQGGRHPRLRTLIGDMRAARAHDAALHAHHTRLRLERREAAQACRLQRAEHLARAAEADEHAAALKDTLEDEAVNAKVRLSYAERWQRARAELPLLAAQQESVAPRRYDARVLQREERVHQELARAFDVATREFEESAENWEARYHADVADINERLQQIRERLHDTLARRKQLQQVFEAHAGEMAGWLKFKGERAARLEREARRATAALHLQAWWRGVMVRRGLGAFKALRAKKQPTKQGKKKG